MSQNININDQQSKTIQYIKKLTSQISYQQEKQVSQDSLRYSNSNLSKTFSHILVETEEKHQKKRKNKKYLSPYNQNHLSINKIQNATKKIDQQIISFQNKILKQATFKTQMYKKPVKSNNSNPKYSKMPSMMQKMQYLYIDKLKAQAKIIYQIQEKKKKQLTPLKRKQLWSDFLLRQRKWEIQKQQKNNNLTKKYFQQSKITSENHPRMPIAFNNSEMIQIIRRNKMKLQQRLRQITPQMYNSKIEIPKQRYRSKSKTIRLSHSMQANFLLKK